MSRYYKVIKTKQYTQYIAEVEDDHHSLKVTPQGDVTLSFVGQLSERAPRLSREGQRMIERFEQVAGKALKDMELDGEVIDETL